MKKKHKERAWNWVRNLFAIGCAIEAAVLVTLSVLKLTVFVATAWLNITIPVMVLLFFVLVGCTVGIALVQNRRRVDKNYTK